MVECFTTLRNDSDVRAIVISGCGKLFTSGLDLSNMVSQYEPDLDVARRAKVLQATLESMQQSFSSIEQVCPT